MRSTIKVIIVMLLWAMSATADTDQCKTVISPMGGYDTFPFGLEQPVPWTAIDGTWMLEGSKDTTRYVFKLEKNEAGANRLSLSVIDSKTCEKLGAGKALENSRVVKGILNQGTSTYLMTLHTFKTQDVKECDPDLVMVKPRQNLTVMTLANVLSPSDRMSMRLFKVRDTSCRKF